MLSSSYLTWLYISFFFFFFQAEDGIRDYKVTGVQTCALPIFRIGLFNFIRRSPEVSVGTVSVQRYSAFLRELVVPTNFNIVAIRPLRGSGLVVCDPSLVRSEERRVGKECRSRWSPYH